MNISNLFNEFKPSFLFLIKFILLYFVFSALYAMYLNQYSKEPDWMTKWVSSQTAVILSLGVDSSAEPKDNKKQVAVYVGDNLSVSVYEGCNGLNMMLLFVAFIISFGGPIRKMLWYIPIGITFIHFANVFRITALAIISLTKPEYYYLFHKYFFTAIIFIAIFILWYIWVSNLVKVRYAAK